MTATCAVVIPTFNAARTIDVALRALTSQTRQPDRIIVIDGDSIDQTRDIVARYRAEIIPEGSAHSTAARARNRGAAAAQEDFLLFIDADQAVEPTVVEECTKLIEAGYDAIVLPESTAGRGFFGKWRTWERARVQREPALVCPRAIRRAAFDQAGRFDPEMIGFEDLDLQARLLQAGCRVTTSSSHITHHEELLDFPTYLGKRTRYMSSWSLFREKHPALAAHLSSPLARLKLYLVDMRRPSDVFWLTVSISMRLVDLSLRPSSAHYASMPR